MVAVKTVVVADDTAFVRDRFTRALEEAGHEALGARSWPELTSIVRRVGDRLDLIALDLRLPQGIGTGMVRALRSTVPATTPIVVFSGTIANAVEVRDLTTLGVAGYLNEYTAVQHILPALAPHLFPEHYQRRLSPRVSLAIPVAYRIGNTITSAVTLNISLRRAGHPHREPAGDRHRASRALPAVHRAGRRGNRRARGVVGAGARHGHRVHRCSTTARAPPSSRSSTRTSSPIAKRSGSGSGFRLPAVRLTTWSLEPEPAQSSRVRSRRSAFATTITDAPVSATTAIHSVAAPVMAATRNTAFSDQRHRDVGA